MDVCPCMCDLWSFLIAHLVVAIAYVDESTYARHMWIVCMCDTWKIFFLHTIQIVFFTGMLLNIVTHVWMRSMHVFFWSTVIAHSVVAIACVDESTCVRHMWIVYMCDTWKIFFLHTNKNCFLRRYVTRCSNACMDAVYACVTSGQL